MGLAFVGDVLSGVQSGSVGMTKARQTFARLFDTMCWEFLDDRQRGMLTRRSDDILLRLKLKKVGYDAAYREITVLVEAAVRRDYQVFDIICARPGERSGERSGEKSGEETRTEVS